LSRLGAAPTGAADDIGIGPLSLCLGISEVLTCGGGETPLKDIAEGSANAIIAQHFGQVLFDAFSAASYTCTASGSDVACTAAAMQVDLQTITADLSTKMTELDTVTSPLAQTLIDSLLGSLNTYIVNPTQGILDMMNCQVFGVQIRKTIGNFCDSMYPGIRGMASAWSFLGLMGVVVSIFMYFIWANLKVKYIWENGHGHSAHSDVE
jgi:hypothetical protein